MDNSQDLAQEDQKRRPLTELCVNGCFAEVYVDVDETIEEQEKSMVKYKEGGDRHFTEEGRVAEITVG